MEVMIVLAAHSIKARLGAPYDWDYSVDYIHYKGKFTLFFRNDNS
jgi:hypothetical protein